MEVLEQEMAETIRLWPKVSKIIASIHTETHYKRAVKLMDELIDELSQNKDPVLESILDTLGTLVKDYEDRNVTELSGDAVGCLKYLMKEHGLRQNDLAELGTQGVVSEILNGKRKLNIRQIKSLSRRFNVSPAVFVDMNQVDP